VPRRAPANDALPPPAGPPIVPGQGTHAAQGQPRSKPGLLLSPVPGAAGAPGEARGGAPAPGDSVGRSGGDGAGASGGGPVTAGEGSDAETRWIPASAGTTAVWLPDRATAAGLPPTSRPNDPPRRLMTGCGGSRAAAGEKPSAVEPCVLSSPRPRCAAGDGVPPPLARGVTPPPATAAVGVPPPPAPAPLGVVPPVPPPAPARSGDAGPDAERGELVPVRDRVRVRRNTAATRARRPLESSSPVLGAFESDRRRTASLGEVPPRAPLPTGDARPPTPTPNHGSADGSAGIGTWAWVHGTSVSVRAYTTPPPGASAVTAVTGGTGRTVPE
jgi:hypothetical protein